VSAYGMCARHFTNKDKLHCLLLGGSGEDVIRQKLKEIDNKLIINESLV